VSEKPAKTHDDYWIDWEADAFGFGYGTGEPHVIPALKTFFALCRDGSDGQTRGYDYRDLEAALGGPISWLLINALANYRLDIIEYGSSPRFGWLTAHGERLKAYVDSKTADDLIGLVVLRDADSNICMPDACNCGPNGYERGRVCDNPFWRKRT
jgi:hypothetical protein